MIMLTQSDNDATDRPRRLSPWVRWAPPLLMLAAAGMLLLIWDRLPERWPVHWGLSGEADGWASKTVGGVFEPLFIGAGIWVLLEMVTAITIAYSSSDTSRSPQSREAAARMTADFIRLVELALSLVFTILAVALPLYAPASPAPFVVPSLVIVFGTITYGMWRMRRELEALKQAGLVEHSEGWHGLIYSNPQDPRLWVPKLIGLGWTLNFAHRRAWAILILIFALPLAVVLAIALLS